MKTLSFDYDNVSGISLIYAVPVSSFLRMTSDPINESTLVELIKRDAIISIPVYAGDSFVFTEIQSLEDGGEAWQVSIEGIIPTHCRLNERHIRALEQGDWLILSRDSNGIVTLSGTTDVPLKFTHSRTTGTSSELNGSRFTFSGKESEPSIIISNDISNL